MHRHNWSSWEQELRPHIYETENCRIEDKVMYNVRVCQDEKCNLQQEKKAEI